MTSPDAALDEPAAAQEIFGDRLPLARSFARLLADAGVQRGLIGPREVPSLWDRHLLNCAVVTELVPDGARVVDVGSGAGLPGLVLAIRRPDLCVDLVEPLERRCTFLAEAVVALELAEQVRVVRGRAESPEVAASVGEAEVVTSRAVAALDRLVGWSLPLLAVGGTMVALKGERAESEIVTARGAIARAGGVNPRVQLVTSAAVTARVVVVEKARTREQRKGRRSG